MIQYFVTCTLINCVETSRTIHTFLKLQTLQYLPGQTEGNINLVKPTGHVMYQQFNIQQLYAVSTLYLCVLYLSENKQRLVPLTAQTDWFL